MATDRPEQPLSESDERLYNAIENALAHIHRKVPTEQKMALIRGRYESPVFFLEANSFALRKMGLTRLESFFFSVIPQFAQRIAQESFGKRPRLNKLSLMAEYLKSLFVGVHVECFYVIMLDRYGYLKDTVLIRKGTTDSTPFYLKEMLSLTVQREARAVVLCHNHPRGTLRPSKEDIACTLRAMNAYLSLGIPMLDHIIIAKNHAVSMRETGVVPTKLWDMQRPASKLVREWVDVDLLEELDPSAR